MHSCCIHVVTQESTCKHGQRRLVAKRSLNALGGVSGICGFVNDEKQLKEIRLNLKFASALEQIKSAEKSMKLAKAQMKRDKHYAAARKKVNLEKNEKFFKSHVEKLTVNQMKAVAFVDCGGARLTGKCEQVREQLVALLPSDSGVPEYPTQDELFEEESGSEYHADTDSDVSADPEEEEEDKDALLSFIDLQIGQSVEVWWKGEKTWFEGKVTGLERHSNMFEVFYFSDSRQLWHYASDYPVRTPNSY